MKTISLILTMTVILFSVAEDSANAGSERAFRKVKTDGPLVYYEGSAIVSGIYHEKIRVSEIGNFEVGRICFSVKGKTEELIPREKDSRSPWFCFSNTADARAALKIHSDAPEGACYVTGTATVKISKYVVNSTESEVHDTANLDNVVTFTKPTFKKECSLYP